MANIFNPLIPFILLAVGAQSSAAPAALLAGRDLDVLKAALDSQCTKADSTPSVISDLPTEMGLRAVLKDGKPDAHLKRLASRASESTRWPLGTLCNNTQVVAESRLAGNSAGAGRAFPGTPGFAKAFEGARALETVSRPLFTTDGKHAVVATNYMCGPLCGNGAVLELELTKDGWKITKSTMTWIS